jgi:hypothetical protein
LFITADLYKQKGATYRDDVLMESAKSKVISDNDISDTQQENNPFVPNPNTPKLLFFFIELEL